MELTVFEMERLQSTWEHRVRYNLSESGVHPMTVRELLDLAGEDVELRDQFLMYCPSNGSPELRRTIATHYPGATEENILVTNGSSEANFLSTWHAIDRGEEVAVLLPNYMQIWGVAKTFGARMRPFHLREVDGRWRLDEEEAKGAITKGTRLIAICNPDNPTGAILDEGSLKLIADLASEADAWVVSDEVYQGAEREGKEAPSLWGLYDRALVTNGLSKAYGLPGLRIGWVAGPKEAIADLWAHHDYTSIGTSILSDRIAQVALSPRTRAKIHGRTRGILRHNFPLMEAWLEDQGDLFRHIPPQAGAIWYMAYNLGINSSALIDYLLHGKSVLIVPGDHFGMDGYLRIGYGAEEGYLRAGLDLISEGLEEVRRKEGGKGGA
jgi:hypothetical protein